MPIVCPEAIPGQTPVRTPDQVVLTPEQEATLEPFKLEYQRALTVYESARKDYEEAYGAYVVATRRLLGEIP